jgi:hypothetical protein
VTTLTEDGSNGPHYCIANLPTTPAGSYRLVGEYKGVGPTPRGVCFDVASSGGNEFWIVIATDGSVVGTDAIGCFTLLDYSVVAAGGGWWRVTVDFTSTQVPTVLQVFLYVDGTGYWQYQGLNDGSGVQFQNVSLKQGLDIGRAMLGPERLTPASLEIGAPVSSAPALTQLLMRLVYETISVVDAPSGTSTTDGTNVSVALPTASMNAATDWIYIFGGHFYRAGVSIGPTTSSWEEIYSENAGGSTNAFGIWRKRWDGAETTVTCYGSGNASDGAAYERIILRNAGGVDVAAIPATGSSTNPNPPSITPVTNGAVVLIAAQSAISDTSPGTVGSYTTGNVNANSTNDMSMSCGYRLGLAAGVAEDPANWSSWGNANWRAVTVAIKPAQILSAASLTIGSPVPSLAEMGGTFVLEPNSVNISALNLPTPTFSSIAALNVMSMAVGNPTFGTPPLTLFIGALGLTIGSPVIPTLTLGQKHALVRVNVSVGALGVGTPSLQAFANLQKVDLTIGSPALSNPELTVGYGLQKANLVLSGPVLGQPHLGQYNHLTATGITLGQPRFGQPYASQVVELYSNSFSLLSPDIGHPALTRSIRLFPESLDLLSPAIGEWHDPYVWHTEAASISTNTGKPIKISLFTNVNDRHEIVAAEHSLLGNSRDTQGPAQKITLAGRLKFSATQLTVDTSDIEQNITDLQGDVSDLQGGVSNLQTDVGTLQTDVIGISDGMLLALDPSGPYPSGGSLTTVAGVWTFTEDTSTGDHNLGFYRPDAENTGQLPAGAYYIEFEVKQSAGATRYFQWYTAETTYWMNGITCRSYLDGTHPDPFQWGVNGGEYWLDGFVIEPSTDGYYKHRLWYRTTVLRPVATYLFLDNVYGGLAGYTGNGVSAMSVRNFMWKRLTAPAVDALSALAYLARSGRRQHTYADLPSNPEIGTMVQIINANVNTFRAAVTGTGSYRVIAWWDGTSWLVMG